MNVQVQQVKRIYLDLPLVSAVIGVATATIQKMVREGAFPAPRILSSRRVAWLMREVEEWAESRPISDLLPPENTGKRCDPTEPEATHSDDPVS